jgi:hypothetical protein
MFQKIRRHAEPDYALAGVLPIGIGADRFVLRRGRIAEERGREQEGQREHRSRAATLDLRSADNCFFIPAIRRPDRTIEGRSTEPHWAFQRRSNAVRRVLNVTQHDVAIFTHVAQSLDRPRSERVTRLSNLMPPNYLAS